MLLHVLGVSVRALKEHFAPVAVLASTSAGGAAASAASYLTNSKLVTAIAGVVVAGTTAVVVSAARKFVDAVANRAEAFFRDFESVQGAIVRIDGSLERIDGSVERLTGVVSHHERFEERTEERLRAVELKLAAALGRFGEQVP